MNIRWIAVLCLILAVLSISCACAADNTTDCNITQEDVSIPMEEIGPDDINITFDERMWQENLTDIEVELPDEAAGEFCIKIDDEPIYNETITDHTFTVPVKLPKPKFIIIANTYPPIDVRTYKVSAFYNGIDLNINRTLKVMLYPPDYNYISFPEEILQYKQNQVVMIFPRSANGTLEFYIDDRLFERTTPRPIFTWQTDPFSSLCLGNHTVRISYLGDEYYRPFNKTFNFTVTNVKITIPKVVNISHDDCIALETLPSTSGTVKVFIDGKLVKSARVENGEFIMSLEGYIKYTSREVKVAFEGNGISRTKSQQVSMTYDFDVWAKAFTYGDRNAIEIMLPDTLNNRLLTVTINGTEYAFAHEQNIANNIVEVDISGLDVGNYSMTVSFAGDDRFYALSRTYSFTVEYGFHVPDEVEYGDASKVYLKLPSDANGNMEVFIDGILFRSVRLNGGYAEARIDSFEPNEHKICLKYTGSDYDVCEFNSSFYLTPKITLTYRFTAGEDRYVTVEVAKSCRGHVIFTIDEKEYKVNIKDGIARISLKNLKAGEHDIYVDYYGANAYEDLYNWRVVTVSNAKIMLASSQATFKDVNIKIKLLTKDKKPFAYRTVTVKFNGKTYKIKTNRKGILTFKKSMKLKKKSYTLKVTYMGAKLTKRIKVSPIAVKVKKTKKRLTVKVFINKKAKNEIVKIKVNNKKFKVRTNRWGVAKLAIKKNVLKKLMKGKKVTYQATYLKGTVKYTVKVKK